MTLIINLPKKLDDFPLKPESRAKLEMILSGIIPMPGVKNGIVLHGIYGSGKTTMAELLPGWLELSKTTDILTTTSVGQMEHQSTNYDYHSCGQSHNGAALITKVQNQTQCMSFNSSGIHYVILDEADLLTAAASASFKSLMNRKDIVFILTTNHLNKIDLGVQNRSVLINLNAPPADCWVEKIKGIYENSGLPCPSDQAIAGIVQAGNGSARNILTDIQVAQTLKGTI